MESWIIHCFFLYNSQRSVTYLGQDVYLREWEVEIIELHTARAGEVSHLESAYYIHNGIDYPSVKEETAQKVNVQSRYSRWMVLVCGFNLHLSGTIDLSCSTHLLNGRGTNVQMFLLNMTPTSVPLNGIWYAKCFTSAPGDWHHDTLHLISWRH